MPFFPPSSTISLNHLVALLVSDSNPLIVRLPQAHICIAYAPLYCAMLFPFNGTRKSSNSETEVIQL